ncbi:MAG: LysM peptidoglycan-binding domain-containing M23 family metallopeptidase [Treponema lecithinolyticum]|uniref:LysM peptidoglycan-binding domain-containing M23 family metallopeptidase n=1 Tax=Treponema lecithinolyticum TaxID=53418 RepID=UPI003609F3EA
MLNVGFSSIKRIAFITACAGVLFATAAICTVLLSRFGSTAKAGAQTADRSKKQSEELVGAELFLSGWTRAFSDTGDNVPPAAGFAVSELFAGQGGYDFDASLNTRTALRTFPPQPEVWAQAIAKAELYPDLTYTAYRIRKGDMISVIADRFGITQDTLISVNNIRQTRRIQIGDYLRIPSSPGILYTTKKDGETAESVAEKYQVSAKKTAVVNRLSGQSQLKAGVTLFVPDAFLDWVTRQEINGDLFKRPLRGRYYMSSYFGWRTSPFSGRRTFHNGVDLASAMWTPVYAALVGKVTATGYSPVYGNYVIVAHHSGYRTLYGHLANIKARTGQSVDTKTVLGWVGNTGLSTGPHLHFSVFKYGSAVNPVSLWN